LTRLIFPRGLGLSAHFVCMPRILLLVQLHARRDSSAGQRSASRPSASTRGMPLEPRSHLRPAVTGWARLSATSRRRHESYEQGSRTAWPGLRKLGSRRVSILSPALESQGNSHPPGKETAELVYACQRGFQLLVSWTTYMKLSSTLSLKYIVGAAAFSTHALNSFQTLLRPEFAACARLRTRLRRPGTPGNSPSAQRRGPFC
jgi:hypothetical protein